MKKIIEKLFCLHDMVDRYTVPIQNDKLQTVNLKVLLVCSKCGKTKVVEL